MQVTQNEETVLVLMLTVLSKESNLPSPGRFFLI